MKSNYYQILNHSNREKQKGERDPNIPASLMKCLDYIKTDLNQNQKVAALWQDWSKIAGDELSSHCSPISFHRGVLVIGASHPQWIQALIFNKSQLLGSLKARGHQVKDLNIKKHYPASKNPSQSEESTWKKHPSRVDIHGIETCQTCKSPAPKGEIKLWGKCGLCRRKDLSL